MLSITVLHNGHRHPTPLLLPPSTPLSALHTAVAHHLATSSTLRLLARGCTLPATSTPLSETPLAAHPTLLVLATPAAAIAAVRATRPDPTLRPFVAPAPRFVGVPRRTRPAAAAASSSSSSDFGFARVQALPGFADTARAEAILEQLRSDVGFLDVMRRKRWRVGALMEMAPEGRVGVDPVCVLGYNVNKGAEIRLRLRTDDRQGFRSRATVRQVLAHELAHNEISEHNNEFKELMRWIEREANAADWKRSRGRELVEGWTAKAGQGRDPLDHREEHRPLQLNVAQRLGGGDASGHSARNHEMQKGEESDASTDADPDGEVEADGREDTAHPPVSPSAAPPTPVRMEGLHDAPSEAKQADSRDQRPRLPSAVDKLSALGFSEGLAALALRENGRDPTRAADWLFALIASGTAHREEKSEEQGRDAAGESTREALRDLQRSKMPNDDLLSALDALHMYLSNTLRNPGVERFAKINAANSGFQRRVGRHPSATAVLAAAGFRLIGGFWTLTSLDPSPLWAAKTAVQDWLIHELYAKQPDQVSCS